MSESISRLRGEHCINIFISYELKERILNLAQKYDRTMADIVRSLIKMGIPIMEGLSEAEERMLNDYISVIRQMRKVKKMGMKENADKMKTELEGDIP
jgi:predicted DNA-binding protein